MIEPRMEQAQLAESGDGGVTRGPGARRRVPVSRCVIGRTRYGAAPPGGVSGTHPPETEERAMRQRSGPAGLVALALLGGAALGKPPEVPGPPKVTGEVPPACVQDF